MDHDLFDSLPLGSVVTHSATEGMCAYRRVKNGTGWAVVLPQEPYSREKKEPGSAQLEGSAPRLTLVRMGKVKEPSAKDQRITELESDLDAVAKQRDEQSARADRLEAETVRLRQVIRAARGTLGAN